MPSYTWSSTRPQKRRRPGTRPGHPTTIPHCSFRSAPGWRLTDHELRKRTTVARLTGQRARSVMPAADTPGVIHPDPGGLSRAAAETAWRSVTPLIAGSPHVRVSRDGGRTYPAKHAWPLDAARRTDSALSTTITVADA